MSLRLRVWVPDATCVQLALCVGLPVTVAVSELDDVDTPEGVTLWLKLGDCDIVVTWLEVERIEVDCDCDAETDWLLD